MTTPNKAIMEKADLMVADLMTDGGYLPIDEGKKFILDTIQAADVLPLVTVEILKSHTKRINKIGINGWVLHSGTTGQALPIGARTKPTTAQVEMTTKLFKGEIQLTDEDIEDNIEGKTFVSTVKAMMAEHVGVDVDNILVNGDTAGATGTPLDDIDGMIKAATTHTVAGGTVAINKTMLRNALKAMPKKYKRLRKKLVFLTSDDAEQDWRDFLTDRGTAYSDKILTEDTPVTYGGRAILPCNTFPDNLGGGANCTNALYLDPKNGHWGFWRKIKFESDRDIRSGRWIMVATLRAGFVFQEKDAIVKITDIKTQ